MAILAEGGEQSRRRLLNKLESASPKMLEDLCQRLVEVLRASSRRFVDDEGLPGSWSRAWQVSALVFCAGDNPEALELLARFVDRKTEANRWVRYWTLAGAVNQTALRVWSIERARELAADSDEVILLRALAWVILAELDDHAAARAALLWCLGEGEDPFPCADVFAGTETLKQGPAAKGAALRALRVLQLPQAFVLVQRIVEEAAFATLTWDAIWVIGKYGSADRSAEAAQTLAAFVVKRRRSRDYYEMVGVALRAIGAIGVPQTDLLLAELDSPAAGVFVEASKALERLLGTKKAVGRLLDLLIDEPGQEVKLADALRCMRRQEVVEALDSNLRCGVPEREEAARLLFVELGGSVAIDRVQALRQDLESRRKAVAELDARQREHVKLIASGDGVATWIAVGMWVALFLVGFLAIILGMIQIYGEGVEAYSGWALAGGGGLFSLLGKLGFSGKLVETAGARAAGRLAIFTGFQRRLQHIDLLLAQRFIDGVAIEVDVVEKLSHLIGEAQSEAQESILALMPSDDEVTAYQRRRSLIESDKGESSPPKADF